MAWLKPHQKKSIIKQSLEKARLKSVSTLHEDDLLLLSFRHLDKTQGHTSSHWEESKILARAIDTLSGACASKLTDVFNNSHCKIYGGFPPKDKTDFKHPEHVPEDAKWASMHITGEQCIIGHVVNHIFFIVFFDSNHKFWISELRNT